MSRIVADEKRKMSIVSAVVDLVGTLAVIVTCVLVTSLPLAALAGAFMHTKAVVIAWSTSRTTCEAIPPRSVVLVPAFLNRGRQDRKFRPDDSNGQLAKRLEDCKDRIALVVTQKAVSDQLDVPTSLSNGTPVMQMHEDIEDVNVKTFAALKAALDRFEELPERVVLMAHPEQIDRALMNLEFLYKRPVIAHYPGEVLYPNVCQGMWWHIKSPAGWISDWFLIQSSGSTSSLRWLQPMLRLVRASAEYPDRVRLTSRIRFVSGRWVEQLPETSK